MKNFWYTHPANFNLQKIIYVIPFLFLAFFGVFQGCKKDIGSIGLDLKDDLLNATYTDTVTVTAYSVETLKALDTLNTTGLVYNYLGYLKDPVFGTTTATFFAQLTPDGNSVNFGVSPKLDSIVLTLRYQGGFYGDTLKPFTVKVFELKEDIESNKNYYQNNSIDYFPENLTYSDFLLYPKPNTKVKIDSLLNPHTRIRLKNELGTRFLDNPKELANADIFKKYFKGLFISAESFGNDGSLVNFRLTDVLSGIQLYYKDDDNKSKRFTIYFNYKDIEPVRFSKYKHDYGAGNYHFVNQVLNNDTLSGEKILYLQSMGGVKTKITFPNVKAFKNKRIVINKAELVITNIGEDLDLYPQPNRLGIQGVTTAGKLVTMPDALTGNATYFGGTYDDKKKEYRFRITRYFQALIEKENFRPYVYLVSEGAAAFATRLVLNGTDLNSPSRLRLEVYYTEY